jgi:ubiquinone/menaquinone biosynthesis C-methylase UbiE
MPIDYSPEENTYPISPENAAEMSRLIVQGRLLAEVMGGALAEQDEAEVGQMQAILDLACGPGGWVLDIAHAYPKATVTGIDISKTMVHYARAQAWSQGLQNAQFEIVDVLKPLPFPDNSFDLVNGRYLVAFMPVTAWPALIKECARVTRPGGIIRFTEPDNYGISTSPALQQLCELTVKTFQRIGHAFALNSYSIGLMPVLRRYLQDAGYEKVQRKAHVFEASVGTDIYQITMQETALAFELLQPYFLKLGMVTEEEFQQLQVQMADEVAREDFCGIAVLLSTWARKSLRLT